ncbi:hypothetical protein ACQR16_10195 [Bradyrhizobium oligotrophicum]|uniref:hypothetical protein n=1 Tax=Bradyrhizobium oligotrophicum TaxID=44255 RepID=UPI003EB8FA51
MLRPIFVLSAVLVSGCGLGNGSHGVSVKPSEVHAFAGVCSAPVADLTPMGYTLAGFDFVDEQCGVFFDGIIELSKDSRYASSSIATANTQAALIMAAVNTAASSLAIVAAGSELARRLIDGYAAEYAFSPYALEVRQLVVDALSAYRADAKTDAAITALETMSVPGDAYCLANNIVRNYAKICSVANVEALARQAVANSRIGKADGPPAAGAVRASTRLQPFATRSARRATAEESANFRRGLSLPNYTAGKP